MRAMFGRRAELALAPYPRLARLHSYLPRPPWPPSSEDRAAARGRKAARGPGRSVPAEVAN